MKVKLKKSNAEHAPRQRGDLEFVAIDLSWAMRNTFGHDFDLDLSCFLLDKRGFAAHGEDFVFYNNPLSPCGAVSCQGDNRVGQSCDCDNEIIYIDLPKVAADVERIVVALSIYEGEERQQSFGLVKDVKVRVWNRQEKNILAVIDPASMCRNYAAALVCAFERENGFWSFKPVEKACFGGLAQIVERFGLEVED